MSEYVIGFDAGGTKSHLALFDTEGNLVDFDHWGTLNHEGLPGSFEQLEDELRQFFSQVMSKNKITANQISYSVLGVAGVDTRLQHRIISEILQRIGLEKFTLVNDAFLGVPAGNPAGIGICAINGTGCTLAGINRDGKTLQIGGVGFISADFGGGGMLGQQAVSAIYSELFRKGESTSMTADFFKTLGITNKYDFVEKIYEKLGDGSINISTCNRMLFDAVRGNDKVAAGILCEVASSYARGISCMIEEMDYSKDEEIGIVLAGSVFVKGEHPFLVDTLKEMISKDKPGFNIKYSLLEVPPVAGAVIWALNTFNGRTGFYEKVRAQLREQ